MLDQNNTGGATNAIQYNSWLANAPAAEATAGAENRSLVGYLDDSGIEDPVREQEDDPLKWVTANWETVTRSFPNQWIVVKKGVVVAHSDTATGLREQINRLGIECPFITKTGRGPIVWRTAYGRY